MTIGNKISEYRKKKGMTQDALAQRLGVTNQAVSKWESDQSCPDVMLLPKIADIFEITVDELFDRVPKRETVMHTLPWADDDTLRVVVYIGHKLAGSGLKSEKLTFQYEGPALNVESRISVSCGDVEGSVSAGVNVSCGNVGGDVDAGGSVSCGSVGGNVDAGSYVSCGDISGDVDAGTDVQCGNVSGDVDAGLNVSCGDVGGDVDAGCAVECGNVEGDVDAGGPVTIRK